MFDKLVVQSSNSKLSELKPIETSNDDYAETFFEVEEVIDKANEGYFIRRDKTKLKSKWRGIVNTYFKDFYTIDSGDGMYKDFLMYAFDVIACLYYGKHHYVFSLSGNNPLSMINADVKEAIGFVTDSLLKKMVIKV